MNNLIRNYEIILKELTKNCHHIESFKQKSVPKLSNLYTSPNKNRVIKLQKSSPKQHGKKEIHFK